MIGAVGGALSSWFVANKVAQNAANSRVVERVERITDNSASSRRDVVQSMSGGVLGIYDSENQFIQNAVVLTGDGIAVTPSLNFKDRPVKVIGADGSKKSVNVLRDYPEKGITVFKAQGSFPAPKFSADTYPGIQGMLIRISTLSTPFFASKGAEIERFGMPSSASQEKYPGLEKMGYLSSNPGANFAGSPLFGDSKELVGLVLFSGDNSLLLPSSDLNIILQDVLKHQSEEESVSVYKGFSGQWTSTPETTAFKMDEVSSASAAGIAGLKVGDLITGIDGNAFSGSSSLWSAFLGSARDNKPITLDIKRGQEDMKISISAKIS